MSVELLKEKWKTVKFNFDFTPINNNALQVSSLGNIRSVSANDGKINNLKGSDINGYKIIRLKFYKPREASHKRKLTIQQNEIIKEETVLHELENDKKKNKTHKGETVFGEQLIARFDLFFSTIFNLVFAAVQGRSAGFRLGYSVFQQLFATCRLKRFHQGGVFGQFFI